MRKWLRKLWLKFELWNKGYCTRHGVEKAYYYAYDDYNCFKCRAEAVVKVQTRKREEADRIKRMIAELRDLEK